jgi:hypothetical protein
MSVVYRFSPYPLSSAYMAERLADMWMKKAEQTKDLDDFIDALEARECALRARQKWIEENPGLKPDASETVWRSND